MTLNDPFLPPVLGDHIPVQIAGIDTPELNGDCAAERALAIQAWDFLVAGLATAVHGNLHAPARDTYFRLNGRLLTDGQDLSQALITASLDPRPKSTTGGYQVLAQQTRLVESLKHPVNERRIWRAMDRRILSCGHGS
jgi:endonuclease YncB( thermonuclease family)